MNDDRSLSIVVPMYNVEDYLPRFLNSIKSALNEINESDYSSLEFIFVNDGSKDESELLIIEFTKLNPDINCILINQLNSGVGKARNVGLNHATHKYVAFLDPDDYIDTKYFSSIFPRLISNKDIYIYSYTQIISEGSEFFYCGNKEISWENDNAIWHKVFKREYLNLNNILFYNKKAAFEDVGFTIQIFAYPHTFEYIDENIYFYDCRRSNSTMNTINQDKVDDILTVVDHAMGEVMKRAHIVNHEAIQFMLFWHVLFRHAPKIVRNIPVLKISKKVQEYKTNIEKYYLLDELILVNHTKDKKKYFEEKLSVEYRKIIKLFYEGKFYDLLFTIVKSKYFNF